MKLGIMQPYFFPYVGYFSLIKNTDRFILFDTTQFIYHGWIERNRILKPREGWQYIAVPLEKHSQKANIIDIRIKNSEDWRTKIIRQLEHYKKIAPYYRKVMELINSCLDIETESITKLNQHAIILVCEYLGIHRNIDVFSEMNLTIEPVFAADEWALNICKALGNVTEYWNPEGGAAFFDKNKYTQNNIGLSFIKMDLHEYSQKRDVFDPGLSIIDVLMFNSPEETVKHLDYYSLF